ncbi:hypothetical protein [Oceanicola sp. S124]|uniref:hypothetical protein n=1 Tax=Oceanicola sp. S124 TaxID=1042378 RepID=UPI00187337FC|nr:hypothetical protein [Oceanicola sp. S124]
MSGKKEPVGARSEAESAGMTPELSSSARHLREGARSAGSTSSMAAASAIGMGLAMQSGSQNGLSAFAATPEPDDVTGDPARSEGDPSVEPQGDVAVDVVAVDGTEAGTEAGAEPEAGDAQAEGGDDAAAGFILGYGGSVTSLEAVPLAHASMGLTAETTVEKAGAGTSDDAPGAPGDEDDGLLSGIVGGLVGDDGLVDDLLGDGGLVDDLLDDLLGEGGAVQGVVEGILGDGGIADGLLGHGGLLDGLLDYDSALGSVVEIIVADNGLLGLVYGEESLIVELTEDLLDGLVGDGGVIDSLLDGVAGEGGLLGSVVGGLSGATGLVDGLVGGVLGPDGDLGSVGDGLLGEDGLVGSLLGGLTGGLSEDGPDIDLLEDVDGDGIDSFLDSLVSDVMNDGLPVGGDLLDGLLGDVDVFGIDVGEGGDELGDMFAGLDDLSSLTGSLISCGIVETLNGAEGSDHDPDVNALLNDLLGEGGGEILGGSGAFEALLGEETPDQGEGLLGDTAIEEAIGTLFGVVGDTSDTLLDGLLPGGDADEAI